MEKLIAKPQLGFTEANQLVASRLTDFNGRSRRSEYWWTMLSFLICVFLISKALSAFLPDVLASLITAACWFYVYGVTVRRLQDTGKSKWWVIVSWAATFASTLYMYFSGLTDTLASVNANPQAAMKVFTDPGLILIGLVNLVTFVAILIFCCLDSKPEPNKYGESPKYVLAKEEEEVATAPETTAAEVEEPANEPAEEVKDNAEEPTNDQEI
ncbi:hypothetical protein HMPREF0663_10990 [Hoylesella oralis ATCC 33269]|uniref:DUF805 domain-containing protein n=1 Tax=Hoylesella oralis ATCC 33269 TaxID=873533 RepID=E7RP89_9BACT|nr:DUF805 domain-containing protein [Hoylesella oralis]EFZ37532.1 hypothetical protein HMPREF0663_10990 [Hoylesella oralis ATCC 33269]EPH16033.1 hypothetical protein HMPREF1475_02162 [Hoylesella oralis HGA0225]SHF90192.1 Uncharacterized membrane protein YhaH, DUF805 family [Hoylesella oralis]